MIITLGLTVDKSKNKNIDHRGKETCAYESDHISLCYDSTMSSVLIFCFLSTLLQPRRKRRKINSKKKNICEISIIILICQKIGSVGPVQQKIKLPLPKRVMKFLSSSDPVASIYENMIKLTLIKILKNVNFLSFRLSDNAKVVLRD